MTGGLHTVMRLVAVGALVLATAILAVTGTSSATAGPSFVLDTGYADCPAPAANGCSASTVSNPKFPTPWLGSRNVQFVGDTNQANPATTNDPDESAIRIDNTGAAALTINDLKVVCGSTTVDLWGTSPFKYPYTVAAGKTIIFSGTSGENFDASEGCAPAPTVTVTIDGKRYSAVDDLAQGGGGAIVGGPSSDESTPWSQIFTTAAPAPPVLGKAVDIGSISGVVLVRKPGQTGFQRLAGNEQIPIGSTVDATHGRVRLTSATSTHGATQTADFYEGAFVVGQHRGQALTTLKLTGGDFATCPRHGAGDLSGPAAQTAAHHPRRQLWGNGHGSFTTSGNSASATVRGTIWLTQDDCEGTLILVKRGVVTVKDLVRHTTIIVHAPHSYFAAAKP